jgi:DinB superfamily
MKLEYSPAELVSELERQSGQARSLAATLSDAALNWRPNGGKSWSVAQCLDHLAIMNRMYLKALHDAVDNNRDQLDPRRAQSGRQDGSYAGFIGTEEPPPKFKLPAPKKLAPPSKLSGAVVVDCKRRPMAV